MESIILFVLIAVGTTIFNAIKQDAEKQRKAQTAPKPNIKIIQPTINSSVKQINTNTVIKKKRIQSDIVQEAFLKDNINNMNEEDILTEALKENVPQKSNRIAEAEIASNDFSFINYDELQRSIVMAEVLGKPRALKKSIR